MRAIDLIEPVEVVQKIEQGAAALPTVQHAQLPSAPVTPADLLRIAMERNDQDLDRLERLMAMQERYLEAQERERKGQAVLSFRHDFAAFRGENVIIPKSKHVDRGRGGSFNQAEFDVVCRMLSPALSKHGFGFRHDQKFGTREWPTPENQHNVVGWVWVTCYLEHRDGHTEELVLEGPPDDQTVNSPVQNMQATASFLKRQSLLAITGTATGGEDDESRLKSRSSSAQANPEDAAALSRLIDQGNAKAEGGMEALNAWWGSLTDQQRTSLMSHFGSMKSDARRADANRSRA